VNFLFKGHLFWFDGIDRGGKSSTIEFLKEALSVDNEVISVESKMVAGIRVPTLLGNFPDEISYMLFWQAIRMVELSTITPALKAGQVVLSDRGPFSQWAYDLWGDLDKDFKKAQDDIYLKRCILPKTAYIFTIPYSAFVERDDGKTILTEEKFNEIQDKYRKWGEQLKNIINTVFVDGTKPKDEVRNFVLEHINNVLKGEGHA